MVNRARTFMTSTLILFAALVAPAAANTTPLGTTKILDSADSRSTCDSPTWVRPFLSYEDSGNYVLAPGGAFEAPTAAGWQLSGQARTVAGNEQFFLRGRSDSRSLSLPSGTRAISPAMCVDLTYPHLRLVSKAVSSPGNALLGIEVVYPDSRRPEWTEVKSFDGYQGKFARSGWRISDHVDIKPQLGHSGNAMRRMAIRITALRGNWQVDDIYIDPRCH